LPTKQNCRKFSDALNAAKAAMRRDECGLWVLKGSRGYVSAWGDGKSYLLYVVCRSGQHWTYTKKRLAFAEVTQDGDEEGCFRMRRLPTEDEARVIRDTTGIRATRPPPMKFISTKRRDPTPTSSYFEAPATNASKRLYRAF
jgi:hypothetical protein